MEFTRIRPLRSEIPVSGASPGLYLCASVPGDIYNRKTFPRKRGVVSEGARVQCGQCGSAKQLRPRCILLAKASAFAPATWWSGKLSQRYNNQAINYAPPAPDALTAHRLLNRYIFRQPAQVGRNDT